MAKTTLKTVLDATDTVVWSISTAVTMRRASWLCILGFPKEVQTTVKDLPFEGSKLLAEKTGVSLHTLKDSRATLWSLWICTPAQKRKFSPQSSHRLHTPEFPPQCYHEAQRKKSKFQRCKSSGPHSSTFQPTLQNISFDILVEAPRNHSLRHQLPFPEPSPPLNFSKN